MCNQSDLKIIYLSRHCFMVVVWYDATLQNANQFGNLKQSSLIMPHAGKKSDMIKNMIRENKRAILFWKAMKNMELIVNPDFLQCHSALKTVLSIKLIYLMDVLVKI